MEKNGLKRLANKLTWRAYCDEFTSWYNYMLDDRKEFKNELQGKTKEEFIKSGMLNVVRTVLEDEYNKEVKFIGKEYIKSQAMHFLEKDDNFKEICECMNW